MLAYLLITILTFSAAQEPAVKNNRLEELLLWKMSEELKLNISEEKQFSEAFKELGAQKQSLNQELQNQLTHIAAIKSKSESETFLKNYEITLKKYNEISLQELSKMKKILGSQKTVQYFSIKNDLTNKVKQLLLNPEGKTEKAIAPSPAPADKQNPKVIIQE